jgi:CHAT domain-containing protein
LRPILALLLAGALLGAHAGLAASPSPDQATPRWPRRRAVYAHPIFWAPYSLIGEGGAPVAAK